MQVPMQVIFRNLEPSAAVEAAVREHAGKLERFAADLISCRVTVAAPHRHHRKGNTYHVSIDLHLPGAEILVNRDPARNQAHEDAYVAIRDAMNAAVRRLEDRVRVRRGKVKRHVAG